jgi:UDP-N-acetylglucosamine acyltransferase
MVPSETVVHPTAEVRPGARLEAGVFVGPGCLLGPEVTIRRGTRLEAQDVVMGRTTIGADCRLSPFVVVGTEPQDVGYEEEATQVVIGDRNVIREFVTIHRGTVKGGGRTTIGDDNYFMNFSHVGHDCRVGSGCVFINNATLGGHVTVDDFVTLSGFTGVHQFCRIGRFAFLGGDTIVTQDVVPFSRVVGSRPALVYGLNVVGLKRRGLSAERRNALKGMFKLLFYSGLSTPQALERIRSEFPPGEDRDLLLDFIASSKRGILKKTADAWDDESE